MKIISKQKYFDLKSELLAEARKLGATRLVSAERYGISGFRSECDRAFHFSVKGCEGTQFRTTNVICLFRRLHGSHFCYYRDEHIPYHSESNCRTCKKF